MSRPAAVRQQSKCEVPGTSPEIRLWTSVLKDAVRTYFRVGTYHSDLEWRRARKWLETSYEHPSRAPIGSFEWVCMHLNISPSWVRETLAQIEQVAGQDKDKIKKILNQIGGNKTRRLVPKTQPVEDRR